jgi:hypothetical protein
LVLVTLVQSLERNSIESHLVHLRIPILTIVWLLIGAFAATLLYFGLARENAKLDAAESEASRVGFEVEVEEKAKAWKRSFRYQL